mmetsp:Transcript_18581/g.40442  ORF Transcript_18581/g.40442 Transcript_18581/m.40442 type:complete len:113 (+) Transcript_18581:887-1225(+)
MKVVGVIKREIGKGIGVCGLGGVDALAAAVHVAFDGGDGGEMALNAFGEAGPVVVAVGNGFEPCSLDGIPSGSMVEGDKVGDGAMRSDGAVISVGAKMHMYTQHSWQPFDFS